MGVDDPTLTAGTDVAARYGITKYEPPPVFDDGESERAHPAFHHYTDLENYRNFPDLIAPGEEVTFTEKLHGMNCRLGLIRDGDEWVFAAGSHNQRRKEVDKKGRPSRFWVVFTEPVRELLRHLRERASAGVVVFGELFGAGVQDVWYGLENGKFALRAFDLAIDGKFLDFDEKSELFERFGVERVPLLYRGPFDRQAIEKHVSGPTTMCPPEKAGKFKGREGIVITPSRERLGPVGARALDRIILKAISFEYLERKGGTEYH
jgi:RNA ligase (TIGR02306 family)